MPPLPIVFGNAMEQIQLGKQDLVFAGGEEEHWSLSCLFDAMGAMASKYNDTPESASRPFSANRDGFVIAVVVAFWLLKNTNTLLNVAQKFMPNWLVMVQRLMVMIWLRQVAMVQHVVCN